ncbi:MAG: DNA polymerase III subunit beta [Coriobacteriia bacterium]|nr:DNA polymerase III subunit beta [Coriobacteriia bacterium]
MRITLARGELLDTLSVVGRALSSRSTLPILSGVLLSAEHSRIVMQATDLEISIKASVEAKVDQDGKTVAPGKMLTDIVRSLPEAAVTVASEGDRISVTSGTAAFSLKTLPGQDFPRFPEVSPESKVELAIDVLSRAAKQVSRAVSRDETRPILTGVLTVVEGTSLRLVATDSYRLAVSEVPLENAGGEVEVVVPGKALEEVVRSSSAFDKVTMGVSENQLVFEFGDITFVSRRIEGAFPNYRQLIPKDPHTKVTLPREELLEAVRRVSLLAQHNTPLRARVAAGDKTLTLSATTQDVGEATEDLMVEAEGEDVEIAFNHAFLADGITSSEGESMDVEIVSPLKPGVLRTPDDPGFLYLLMPVRLG